MNTTGKGDSINMWEGIIGILGVALTDIIVPSLVLSLGTIPFIIYVERVFYKKFYWRDEY